MKPSPTKTETALPVRRGKADGVSERAARQLPRQDFFPVGSGLVNALSRRTARVAAEIEARWPLGCREQDFEGYHRTLRRWVTLRLELTRELIAGGVL